MPSRDPKDSDPSSDRLGEKQSEDVAEVDRSVKNETDERVKKNSDPSSDRLGEEQSEDVAEVDRSVKSETDERFEEDTELEKLDRSVDRPGGASAEQEGDHFSETTLEYEEGYEEEHVEFELSISTMPSPETLERLNEINPKFATDAVTAAISERKHSKTITRKEMALQKAESKRKDKLVDAYILERRLKLRYRAIGQLMGFILCLAAISVGVFYGYLGAFWAGTAIVVSGIASISLGFVFGAKNGTHSGWRIPQSELQPGSGEAGIMQGRG